MFGRNSVQQQTIADDDMVSMKLNKIYSNSA